MFRLDVSHLQAPSYPSGRTEVTTRWTKTVANNVKTQEKILTSTVWNKTNHKGWKTDTTKYTYRQNLQENSTQHYRANTPGGDSRKITQLSIINKESRNILTPTVMWQWHPIVEYPVNISALKRKEFYILVVSCLNTAWKKKNTL